MISTATEASYLMLQYKTPFVIIDKAGLKERMKIKANQIES